MSRNRVVPVLMALFALGALFGPFLARAPNRLVSGAPVALWNAVDRPTLYFIVALAGLLLAVSQIEAARDLRRGMLLLAAAVLLAVLYAAGDGAARLMHGEP